MMSATNYNETDTGTMANYFGNSDLDQSFATNLPQPTTTSSVLNVTTLPTVAATHYGQTNLLESLIVPLYGIIFLLSIVGNSLVLITLARNKRMRTVTNVYLLNLVKKNFRIHFYNIQFNVWHLFIYFFFLLHFHLDKWSLNEQDCYSIFIRLILCHVLKDGLHVIFKWLMVNLWIWGIFF